MPVPMRGFQPRWQESLPQHCSVAVYLERCSMPGLTAVKSAAPSCAQDGAAVGYSRPLQPEVLHVLQAHKTMHAIGNHMAPGKSSDKLSTETVSIRCSCVGSYLRRMIAAWLQPGAALLEHCSEAWHP